MPDIRHIKTKPTGPVRVKEGSGKIKASMSNEEILRKINQDLSQRRPRFFWKLVGKLARLDEVKDWLLQEVRSHLKKGKR